MASISLERMCHESTEPLIGFAAFALMGLVGSTHCMGMCGPLAALWMPTAGPRHLLFWYHLGRWWSYVTLGIVVALLAGHLHPIVPPRFFFWLAMAFLLVNLLSHTPLLPRAVMPWIVRRLRPIGLLPPLARALLLGLLTPLLPCGLLYGAISACAAAPHATLAAGWMTVFTAGTIPLLLLTQSSVQWLRACLPTRFLRPLTVACAAISIGLLWSMSYDSR